MSEPATPRRWRSHRYLKFAFLDDLDQVRHIPIGRLGRVRLAVTPTVWLQLPLFFGLGIALTYLPGRLALGTALAARIADALTFTVAGLLANTLHGLGHIVSGTLAGSPMDELLFTATRDANIYHGDQSAIRGRTHIARASGGPLANLLSAALVFALLRVIGDGQHPYLARIAGLNLAYGLGALLPLPSVDGEVIWRELWRGLRGLGSARG